MAARAPRVRLFWCLPTRPRSSPFLLCAVSQTDRVQSNPHTCEWGSSSASMNKGRWALLENIFSAAELVVAAPHRDQQRDKQGLQGSKVLSTGRGCCCSQQRLLLSARMKEGGGGEQAEEGGGGVKEEGMIQIIRQQHWLTRAIDEEVTMNARKRSRQGTGADERIITSSIRHHAEWSHALSSELRVVLPPPLLRSPPTSSSAGLGERPGGVGVGAREGRQ